MFILRTNTDTSSGPINKVPRTPVKNTPEHIQAEKKLEKGFMREAVRPRGNSRRLRALQVKAQNRELCEKNGNLKESAKIAKSESPEDSFCFMLTPLEMEALIKATGCSEYDLKAFQDMVSGKPYSLRAAQQFASSWCDLGQSLHKELKKLPCHKFVDKHATAFANSGERIKFVHSTIDKNTEKLQPSYDLGARVASTVEDDSESQPVVEGILNPASRSGWGKSGASKAIQDGAQGTDFERKQKALYRNLNNTNLVGNASVGQAFVVPVSDDRVIFSVAGPNHKHHTGLRFKVPRLSHRRKPNHVSKSQERKLRAAYRTFFASVEQYNKYAEETDKPNITKLNMAPISANTFGFPKDKAASIMVQEILHYTAKNPNIEVLVLAMNDSELAGLIADAFYPIGVKCSMERGIPKEN